MPREREGRPESGRARQATRGLATRIAPMAPRVELPCDDGQVVWISEFLSIQDTNARVAHVVNYTVALCTQQSAL